VHRDLKPANVLLAEDGPRVIDFGIARALDDDGGSRLTHTGWLVGSPQYMSPEQADGRELTPASDVFSLGSVLVMACTGTSPFKGSSPQQTLYRVVHAEPDLSALPSRAHRIAAACLAKDPGARPDLSRLREMIGDITASVRPWPAPVHKLIADQRAEVTRLLDEVGGLTVDLAAGTPTIASTRLELSPPSELDDEPSIGHMPASGATRVAALAPGHARRAAIIGVLASVATLVGLLAWTQLLSSGSPASPGDTSTTKAMATNSSPQTTAPPGPESWNTSATDQTPFTEDALLPRGFTNDKGIEFARVAGGLRRCDQAASGDGPFPGSDVVKELTANGCTEVMTGVYLEQPGPNATPHNPVLVSVQVFPFPDSGKANNAYNFLNGGARWNRTTWCTQTGVGSKPCIPGISHGLRVSQNRVSHRYVIAAVANRTDLSNDNTIQPWLASAAAQAANSSGPENYRGP
jgi:hypothetical protein